MLAIVGGTGRLGGGLARRFAAAGETILIGSRDPARAASAAAAIRDAVPGARVDGSGNEDAARRASRVILALPAEALAPCLQHIGPALSGKLLVDVVVPLGMRDGFAEIVPLGAPSAAELVRRLVPSARVVAAFKNTPADTLADLAAPLAGDVIVCSDDAGARADGMALVGRLAGLRAVDGGPLANARYTEAITALLVNLNRLHATRTSIAILGLRE